MGTQYRSAIYYKNNNNRKIILASKEQYQKELNKKIFGLIEAEIKLIGNYFMQKITVLISSDEVNEYCSASQQKSS